MTSKKLKDELDMALAVSMCMYHVVSSGKKRQSTEEDDDIEQLRLAEERMKNRRRPGIRAKFKFEQLTTLVGTIILHTTDDLGRHTTDDLGRHTTDDLGRHNHSSSKKERTHSNRTVTYNISFYRFL